MRTRIFILFGVLALAGFLLAQSSQQLAKPVPQAKATGTEKVDAFLKAVQGAKSLQEVRAAYEKAGFSQAELDGLKAKFDRTPSLKQKFDQLRKEARTAAKPRIERSQAAAKSKLTAIESKSRNVKVKAQLDQRKKINDMLTGRFNPNVECAAETPAILKVHGAVTPGEEFYIEGRGFGATAGTVNVALLNEGRVYRATTTEWNACGVWARISGSIEGVKADQAEVTLETSSGKKAAGRVNFLPLIEYRTDTVEFELQGYCCGNSADWKAFDYKLQNDWYVCGTTVEYTRLIEGNGHAEITHAPDLLFPDGLAKTEVHGGVSNVGLIWVDVYEFVAGPKGLPHRY